MSKLRSAAWFETADKIGHIHRERMHQAGFTAADFRGKPAIGVFSTWSELNPCHIHLRERAEDVKRGIWQAGGIPLEVPCMSLGEAFVRPTAMMYRDLLAMEVEENLRCHPLDGVVLMGGCDKTTPAMLMGAVSMNLPAIYVPAGPMLTGRWRGRSMGSGTDVARFHDEHRAGRLSSEQLAQTEAAGARSPGTCMTMGTASTMCAIAEVMGMSLPGASSIPAVDSRHRHMASLSGRRIVELVQADVRPRDIMGTAALSNALTALMALGGSTNAVIHLIAIADRLGLKLDLADFDTASQRTPVLANLKPSGSYLMEDFFEAGGLSALLSRLTDQLVLDAPTVSGSTLGANIADAEVYDEDVIRPRTKPLLEEGALVTMRGSLAPGGCVLKRSAASPHLLQHTGRAVVFDSRDDMMKRIDDPDLPVDKDSVLVLRNSGLLGVPGMPEWGMLPIPRKLLQQGVTDLVRISDARMSGTHYGTVVLHVTPEAALGSPLALVRDGDQIQLDVEGRRLDLLVGEEELAKRREQWTPPERAHERGWARLFTDHARSASEGGGLAPLGGVGVNPDPAPTPILPNRNNA